MKRVAEARHQFPAKDLPQHGDGQKEPRARVDPTRARGCETAGGHDTVDVRMMLQALPPRVEDHETANRRAQAFRVGRDLQQRRHRGPKQEVVNDRVSR